MKSKYSYYVEDYNEKSRPRRFLEAFAAILKHSNYRFVLDIYARTSTKCARCSVTCPVFQITQDTVEQTGRKFLAAVKEAGRIYRHIKKKKGSDAFVTEVSIDESDQAQSPVELFFILSAVAQEAILVQTIAPKFTGRFNKGVDYVGDPVQFEREFNQDIAVINHAIKEFSLPSNLKLSIHSGSDKFSIYPVIKKALKIFDAGLHLKTAGTTWLEEIIDVRKTLFELFRLRIDQTPGQCQHPAGA